MDISVQQQQRADEAEDAQYLELPGWRAYDDVALTNRVDIDELEDAADYDL